MEPAVKDFANRNRVVYMATIDNTQSDQPRVRAMDMWKAEDSGFYFHNNAGNGLYEQLSNNRKVELHFASPNPKEALRVTGEVEFLGKEWAEDYYNNYKSGMRGRRDTRVPEDKMMFRIAHGEAWFRPAQGKRTAVEPQKFKF